MFLKDKLSFINYNISKQSLKLEIDAFKHFKHKKCFFKKINSILCGSN